jgi:hypothetical protein
MANELDSVVKHVQATVGAISSAIRAHPNYPPDQVAADLYTIAYIGEGDHTVSAGQRLNLQNVVLEIHTPAAQGLARAIERLMPYADSVPKALLADTSLGGHADTFSSVATTGILREMYDIVETVCIRFTIKDVKVRSSLT